MTASPVLKIARFQTWALAGVGIAAAGFAVAMLVHHYAYPDELWHGAHHDRNGHLAEGLNYALELRAFDLVKFLSDVLRAQVWPPIHGLVLALVMVVFGPDPRLGIVPSLFGWSATIVVVWLTVDRLFNSRPAGIFAGGLAVIFALASPSFRLLGSDVMFEALGSALSALSLYLYLAAQSSPGDIKRWRTLAIVLTILFFEKYNYWGLVVVALAISWLAEHPKQFFLWLREAVSAFELRSAPLRIVKSPLIWAAVLTGGLVTVLYARGPASVNLFGRAVSLYPPENLVTATYALLFASVAIWWRRNRSLIAFQFGPAAMAVVRWHVAVVAISFLLPKRLSAFLWFVGPSNNPAQAGSHPLDALVSQWPAFAEGFHVATWSAVLVLVLALIGACRIPSMVRGGLAIPVFTALCAFAVLAHPQQQWRFQATWMFGLWICAGVGGGLLMDRLVRSWTPTLRIVATACVLALIAFAHLVQVPSAIAERAAIREFAKPSDMEFARAMVALAPGNAPIGIVASFGRTPFPEWVLRAECRCLRVVDAPWTGATRDQTRLLARNWLAETDVSSILVIDALADYPQDGVLAPEILAGSLEAMSDQDRFKLVSTVPVPQFKGSVARWERIR